MKNKKGVTESIVVIIVSAIALIVGLWMISATVSSLPMPVVPYSVINESMTLTNLTWSSFGTQANCLGDYPQNQLCGIQIGGVTSITNGTDNFNVGNVTYDNNGLQTMRIEPILICSS